MKAWTHPGALKSLLAATVLILCALQASFAQPQGKPFLVREIPPTTMTLQNYPQVLGTIGNTTLFWGNDPGSGAELWKTDGTTEETALVRDINPGPDDSARFLTGLTDHVQSEAYLGTMGGSIFFAASDSNNSAADLWKSDGTLQGTVKLGNVYPYCNAQGRNSAVYNGALYFFGHDEVSHKDALWKTDGTPGGTMLIKNISPGLGADAGSDYGITTLNGMLLFGGYDENLTTSTDTFLWTSDGTAAGTRPLKSLPDNFRPQLTFSEIANGKVFFLFSPVIGLQSLWVTDGTSSGTQGLMNAGSNASSVDKNLPMAVLNGKLYLLKKSGDRYLELWESDGTIAGTRVVQSIGPYDYAFATLNLVAFNGKLYFFVSYRDQSSIFSLALWQSDGTASGTVLFKQLVSPGFNSNYSFVSPAMAVAGNALYFTGESQTSEGSVLRKTDGTVAGTTEVPGVAIGSSLTPAANRLYYNGFSGDLWTTDGSAAGTKRIPQILMKGRPEIIDGLVPLGNQVIFAALNQDFDIDFWKSDGTSSGTVLFTKYPDLIRYEIWSYLTAIGGKVFMKIDRTLWQTDGTKNGTFCCFDAYHGSRSADIGNFLVSGRTLFFLASTDDGTIELWKNDESATIATKVFDFSGFQLDSVSVTTGDKIFFWIQAGHVTGNDSELWKVDGTSSATLVRGGFDCEWFGTLGKMVELNGEQLFFALNQKGDQTELWKSDGTPTGTVRLFNTGLRQVPTNLVTFRQTLFFDSADSAHGRELWKSDGTEWGTMLVKDINPGPADSAPGSLVAMGRNVYFSAYTPESGRELWKSDGTPEGTMMVKDICPGPSSSSPQGLVCIGGILYFSAYDPAYGVELWMSDGTADGTVRISDISPGPMSSNPALMTRAGNYLFFRAIDGSITQGYQLWAVKLNVKSAVKNWRLYSE